MKKWIALLSLIVSVTGYGFEEFHEFALKDGATFDAIILSCNSQDDTVELLTPDGQAFSSYFSDFTSDNQDYLKQWELCDLFMSPERFVVMPSHTVTRQWAGKAVGAPDMEGRSLASGVSEHRYGLTVYNLGTVVLENVTMDYRITTSEMGSDSQVAEGVIPVDPLDAGGWKLFSTRPVILVDRDAAPVSSQIQIMVHMELPDGTLLSREIELLGYQSADS